MRSAAWVASTIGRCAEYFKNIGPYGRIDLFDVLRPEKKLFGAKSLALRGRLSCAAAIHQAVPCCRIGYDVGSSNLDERYKSKRLTKHR